MAEDDLTTPQGEQEGAQDILFLKIKKLLEGTHRQLSQQFMEILLEGSKEQIELLECVVKTLYRQLRRSKSAGAKIYAWRGEGSGISHQGPQAGACGPEPYNLGG